MDLSDLFLVVAVILGVAVLIGAAVVGYVWRRYQVPPRGLFAMITALFYLATPVDVLPEIVLGPLGLVDDAGVITGVAFFVYRLVRARKALQAGGVIGHHDSP
ncbi:DUF1232 domain-containing protein [Nocardioides sp.]|uniref:DUF1232 domain-containing protein n=1 Tax=Nocardioides sp. TaxID=35761 RepID=UPI002B271131|nr:DUF1232 domain-containing protein [Nocardioides sp.]